MQQNVSHAFVLQQILHMSTRKLCPVCYTTQQAILFHCAGITRTILSMMGNLHVDLIMASAVLS